MAESLPEINGGHSRDDAVMNDTALLEVQNLSFSYQPAEPLFSDLTLSVRPGEILWLTGPPACGKTTLLKLILGELTPDSGECLLAGQSLVEQRDARRQRNLRRIGVIRETDQLLPDSDLFSSVALPLEIKGVGSEVVTRRVHAVLHRVGLVGKLRHRVSQLSATERRLTSLAAALAKDPVLILADLNPGDLQQAVLIEQLRLAAEYGSAALIFSQRKVGTGTEYSLAGGVHAEPEHD